jgi:Domain of unknown function (DUF4177)
MTTLRLSQPETSGAMIADLQTRAELSVAAINDRAVEYRVVYVTKSMGGLPNDGVEDDLNKAAREGWRLVGSLTNDEARTTGLIMERETPNVRIT